MSDGGPPTTRPRRGRITRSGDFDAVYRRGRSAANRHLVLYAFARPDASPNEPPRLGLSVSRKVGGAVERNRVKRVLREQFAQLAPLLPRSTDFVVIAPELGIIVIEVKGWNHNDILGGDQQTVRVRNRGVEKNEVHPVRQARGYQM